MKKYIAILMILLLLLCGCSKNVTEQSAEGGAVNDTEQTATDQASIQPPETDFSTETEMFTERDKKTAYENAVSVILSGSSATASSDAVTVSGSTVTVTKEGVYELSGTLDDGIIIVNTSSTEKVQIVLNGANITSSTTAPLYIKQADKVFITLAEGSQNSITAGDSFTLVDDNNIDGALFSKDDLTINGSGSLAVTSPAGHGIVVKDDFVVTGGDITVECSGHGVDANDSVRITQASLIIDAGKDGIHAENNDDTSLGFVYVQSGTLDIAAEGDGISANSYMQIEGGDFTLLTGGGSENAQKQTSDSWGGMGGGMPGGMMRPDGMGGKGGSVVPTSATTSADTSDSESSTSIKGLKSTGSMLISGGSFNINSADDAVHSNASVTVSGGSFEIASGDDGFHADETLTIQSGTINITESYEGLEALDVKVTGGDIKLVASDDGINAAGGTDSSGFGGARGDEQFGGRGGFGGMGGMSSSSNGSIVLSGGKLYIEASGDGIDANGTFEMTGGDVTVCGPTQGDTATLDYDTSAVISGGTFIGTGASGMAQTFSEAKQGLISVSVGNQASGTEIILKDKSGNTLLSHTPALDFAVVILSSPEIKSGETYTVYVGSQSADFEAE